jgi:hypothetical protein
MTVSIKAAEQVEAIYLRFGDFIFCHAKLGHVIENKWLIYIDNVISSVRKIDCDINRKMFQEINK